MKIADRYNAKYSIIIGQSELESGALVIKDMKYLNKKQLSQKI